MGLNCVGNGTFEEYKVKIETIVEQLLSGEKHLVIWGAGENGERFKCYCDAIHMPVRHFVDNNPDLWGTVRWETPIISPEELYRLKDVVVLISLSPFKVAEEVAGQIKKGSLEEEILYFDDILVFLLLNTVRGRTEAVAEAISGMYRTAKGDEYLQLSMLAPNLVTTKCTLKCRDCMVRIPYLKEHKDADADLLLAELDRTLEIVDSIKTLEVCGGETFLFGNLVYFLNKLKRYKQIMSICVITNGTVIPDDAVFDVMQNSQIVLKISKYGDISSKIPALKEKCRERSIPCFVQDNGWLDPLPKEGLNYSQEALEKLFDECTNKDSSLRNYDGVLYRCGFLMTWRDMGVVDDIKLLQKDVVDLNDRTDDKALKKRLKEYVTSTVPFEICKYCKGNTVLLPRAIQL